MGERTVDVLADLRTVMSLYDVDLTQTIAAVAELIEATDAYMRGSYHDPEVESSQDYSARRAREHARVSAALARVGGASHG